MNDALLKLYIKVRNLAIQEDGQDMVEYALIIGMIAVAAVATLNGLGGAITTKLTEITTKLNAAGAAGGQ